MQVLVNLIILFLTLSKCDSLTCGVKKVKYAGSLISGGQVSYAGQWPWLASLHLNRAKEIKPRYFCGSSIINEWTLLTAAHCVFETLDAEVYAYLGRYNIDDDTERNWVRRDIVERKCHDDYHFYDEEHTKADADIAILIMNEPVTFTNHIQPICLPSSKEYVFDVSGVAVGYGQESAYSQHKNLPQFLTMTSVDLTTCVFSNKQSLLTVSKRSFCAKSNYGTPCLGDSGGGFFKQILGKWSILGIVSHALDAECSPDEYVTFVNVKLFNDWIEENMKKFEGVSVTTRMTTKRPTQITSTIKSTTPVTPTTKTLIEHHQTQMTESPFFRFDDDPSNRVRPLKIKTFEGTTREHLERPTRKMVPTPTRVSVTTRMTTKISPRVTTTSRRSTRRVIIITKPLTEDDELIRFPHFYINLLNENLTKT